MDYVRRITVAVVALTCVGSISACGSDDSSSNAPTATTASAATSTTSATPALEDDITVFAAASLTEAFGELGTRFKAAHPGVKVNFNFGPSSGLATQITDGAPADVFASADEKNMKVVSDAGGIDGEPTIFARNQLEIAVPPDNPGSVRGLADFAKADLLIALCAEEVPCGKFGRQVLSNAGVTPSIDSNEADVKSLLTKVESGDVDAGLVYRTDVQAAGDKVKGIAIPDAQNVTAAYPVAALKDAKAADVAAAFVAFVVSDDARSVLDSFGFLAP